MANTQGIGAYTAMLNDPSVYQTKTQKLAAEFLESDKGKEITERLNKQEETKKAEAEAKQARRSTYQSPFQTGYTDNRQVNKDSADLENSAKNLIRNADDKRVTGKSLKDSLKQFMKDYNETIDALKNSDDKEALKSGSQMVNTTSQYEEQLEKLGLKVNSDNKLEVEDEKKLEAAAAEEIKAIFGSGTDSFASKVKGSASDINDATSSYNQTYTRNGTNVFGTT
ncbi:MAG: hypothetical protein LBM87_07120 [Ruminococcus sp.]|jgi:hypothetical protein|nr:hypothetical protein [Ruminococcus sp.]